MSSFPKANINWLNVPSSWAGKQIILCQIAFVETNKNLQMISQTIYLQFEAEYDAI